MDIALEQSKPNRDIVRILLSKKLFQQDSEQALKVEKILFNHAAAAINPPMMKVLISLLPPEKREDKNICAHDVIHALINYFSKYSLSTMDRVEKIKDLKINEIKEFSEKIFY